MTLGDRITTSLTAGSSATYTFDINEGDAFVLDSLVTENVGVNFVVFDPLGQQIYQANTNIDSGPTTALFSGTYSVVLENTLQTDASLAFRLAPVTDLVIQEGDIINAEFIEQNALSIHRLISEGENLVLRPIRDKQFSTASSFNNVSQFLTTDQGGTEDGYLGVAAAYEDLEFRENAASSIVLVTDQDRDIVRQDLTFDSLVQTLFERDIALSVIVDGDFDDANGNAALGIQNNLNTFVADGNGGFIEEPGGVINGADGQSEADYIDLAFALNGVAYDLNELREGGDRADSFTEAFVEVSTRAISDQFGLTVIPSSPNFNFENLTGVVNDVLPGDTVNFDVQFDPTQAGVFDVLFVREGTGVVVGSLPVRVAGTYEYTAVATDADGDTLTYSIQSGPADATIDPATGIIDWRPTETGQFEFEILVEDGNGGSSVQAYAVDVVAGRDNRQPVITSSPIRFVEAGDDYRVRR